MVKMTAPISMPLITFLLLDFLIFSLLLMGIDGHCFSTDDQPVRINSRISRLGGVSSPNSYIQLRPTAEIATSLNLLLLSSSCPCIMRQCSPQAGRTFSKDSPSPDLGMAYAYLYSEFHVSGRVFLCGQTGLHLTLVRRGSVMVVSYKKLWKLLIDKDMKKKDLAAAAHLSTFTVNKLNRGENVNTDTLVSICQALNCTFEDIMELVPGSGSELPNNNNLHQSTKELEKTP